MVIATLGFVLLAVQAAGPAPEEDGVAITGVRILTVSHGEIESGTILLHGDKIAAVGEDVKTPPRARVIERKGWTAFPGIVNPLSRLGMGDAPSAGGGAHHLALDEFNPVSDAIAAAARSGVTIFALQPSGTGIAGRGAFVKPAGWSRSQQVLDKKSFLRIVLQPGTAPKEALRQALEAAKKAMDSDKGKTEEKTAPLVQFLKGDLVGLVEVGSPAELLHFWQVLDSIPDCTPRIVLSVTPDAYKAVSVLGARKARVLLRPVLAFAPFTRERINTAAELEKAGVQVGFAPGGDSPELLDGVFFRVAELVKYGLPREAGLRGLTLGPAEMLGIDDHCGSLDPGKDADLILLSADPLSPQAQVKEVYVNGRPVFPGER
jgi:hypothetical protein